jgi:cytochrome c
MLRSIGILVLCGGLAAGLSACGSPDEKQPASEATSVVLTAPADLAPPAFSVCNSCHSIEPGVTRNGPSLAGVFGRKAGQLDGFFFTDEMKQSGLTWDRPTLDKWLTAPQLLVPGTRMAFTGIADAEKRKGVIDYLETLK